MTASSTPQRRGACSPRDLLILAALAFGVYLVCLANGFVWDDDLIIVKNPATLHLSGIADLLFSPDVVKPYYRPLNRASYLVNYWLSGMNPGAFHAVNLLVHVGNVVLLYLVALKLSGERVAALVAAALLALHPVNSEAVNFISGRNNLLALFFVLASFWFFAKERDQSPGRVAAAAVLFFCALLSKETGLMVIVPVALYAFVPLTDGESGRRRWAFPVAFAAATLVYLAMRAHTLNGVTGTANLGDGLWQRLALNFEIIPRYLGLILFPAGLTVFQPMPGGGAVPTALLAIAWLAIAAGLFFVFRSRNKVMLFGLVWFAANYLPISNLVPIPSAPVAERYLYLPAVGLWLLAGEAAALLWGRASLRRPLVAIGIVLALVLGARTVQRTLQWRDDFTLFASAVNTDPASPKAHFNLGNVLKDRGDLAGAEAEWQAALRLKADYPEPLVQLATLSAVQGNFPRAAELYQAALRLDPKNAMAHYNLGKVYELLRVPTKAAEEYRAALSCMGIEYQEYEQDIRNRLARLQGS